MRFNFKYLHSALTEKKNKMKKRYTKRQIIESIKYWQKQLNENISYSGNAYSLLDEIKELVHGLNIDLDDLANEINVENVDILKLKRIWELMADKLGEL